MTRQASLRRPLQATAMLLGALLALTFVRSDLLVEYAYELPQGPVAETVVGLAETLDAFAAQTGLGAARQAILDGVATLRGNETN